MNPLFIVLFASAASATPSIYPHSLHHDDYYGLGAHAAYPVHTVPVHTVPVHTVPAPHVAVQQGPGYTSVHQPPSQVSKQTHLGSQTYLANVHHSIIKPPTPHFPIAVSKVLKEKVVVNPTISKTVVQTHVVNKPIPVEKKIEVPYDVPVVKEVVREIPQPVHVAKPVPYPVPTPVVGEPIVKVIETAPIVHETKLVATHGYPHSLATHGYPHSVSAHGYPHLVAAHGHPVHHAGSY